MAVQKPTRQLQVTVHSLPKFKSPASFLKKNQHGHLKNKKKVQLHLAVLLFAKAQKSCQFGTKRLGSVV